MAIKINFDLANNPESPTLVLAHRNGRRLGQLDAKGIVLKDPFNDIAEISFNLYKYIDDELANLWNDVVDFKLIYCKEWDMWFEIRVELDEETETVKTVFGKQLGQAELSQIMLYDIEINTEDDILRDDYKITILYDENDHKASLLHRLLHDKAPHYSIIHVDESIRNIQRTFSFDGTSIYDALIEIGEEIGCLFVFPSNTKDGKIQRTIAVYDLRQTCMDCRHRGDYTDICSECGSTNIKNGYGNDTTIFITADALADGGIQLTTDTNSVKNCFKLETGDELMTATVRNCNPNGTDYIWYFSDDVKADMTNELVNKLDSYDELYQDFNVNYVADINEDLVNEYNALIVKYQIYNEELATIPYPIVGYSNLMKAYYNTIDLALFLESGLMPSVEISKTDAATQAALLTAENLSPVAVSNIKHISLSTANTAVLAMANVVLDSRFKIKINASELNAGGSEEEKLWTGNFVVTDYSNEEDEVISETITITITGEYEEFLKQKIDKALNKSNVDNVSITGLFNLEYDAFCEELKKYALNRLISFKDACQACLDILIEQGITDGETWGNSDPNLYEDLYTPYYNKLQVIEAEIKIRQDELDSIEGVYDINYVLVEEGLQTYIIEEKNNIQKSLDFQNYLGDELWFEFCSYRREDKLTNDNYISEGLDNAALFKRALEFMEFAKNEIYKAAELQHSISTNLKNLLAIDKFKPLVKQFKSGNWIRVMVDNQIYKLRLLDYEIDYDNFDNISVSFSDVIKIKNGINDVKSVLSQASSMASSYSVTQREANRGAQSNVVINDWLENGLDATNTKIIGGTSGQTQTWDSHGLLFREYDDITGLYSDEQMKIINSTIAVTDDNWKTTKTAVGKFYYTDPANPDAGLNTAYGINGEAIIGQLLIGQRLGIYNDSGSLSFNNDGFVVKNENNTVAINPNDTSIFTIKNNNDYILHFNDEGDLVIRGDILATHLTLLDGSEIEGIQAENVSGLANVAISGKYEDLVNAPDYSKKFDKPANDDSATVGQIIVKQENGSMWASLSNTITNNGTSAVTQKAVYDYALNKNQGTDNSKKLLYIDDNGEITSIGIEELKTLLGI